MTRQTVLQTELEAIDGQPATATAPLEKHVKMARSPLQFLRGSAQLMYADLASGVLTLPPELSSIPATRIMGDCHFSNFGFFTEEGSHNDTVIWAPNDFDDAAKAPAMWDIIRFMVSLHLTEDYLQGLTSKRYTSEDYEAADSTPLKDGAAQKGIKAFLNAYVDTCAAMVADAEDRDRAITSFKAKTFMAQHLKKAQSRVPGGKKFATKSTVGKLCTLEGTHLKFAVSPKLAPLSPQRYKALEKAFRPWLDDSILDIVQRLDAGTGSVNVERFYFLVGPAEITCEADMALATVVEAKQQRAASLIRHFPDLHPENTMFPAHLTVDCQRLMARKPDLVLDELVWKRAHWLIRSRHHARYNVGPEDILLAKDPAKAFNEYVTACGVSLARAHARGDRRSTRFEQAITKHLPAQQASLMKGAATYADQVKQDYGLLKSLLDGKA